jgi:hypothetical protein
MKNLIFWFVIFIAIQTQVVYANEEINLAAAIGASAVEKPATEQPQAESEGMSPKTRTMLIIGGVVAAGILAAASASNGGGGTSATSH